MNKYEVSKFKVFKLNECPNGDIIKENGPGYDHFKAYLPICESFISGQFYESLLGPIMQSDLLPFM